MNAYQLAAYETPVDDGTRAGTMQEGRHNHGEVHGGIPVSVVLTADIGHIGEDLFGFRGLWHCSIAVWPGLPMGQGRRPLPPATWTAAQRRAAERAAKRNLAGVGEQAGEERRITAHEGPHALHCYLPMSPAERAGLGLP